MSPKINKYMKIYNFRKCFTYIICTALHWVPCCKGFSGNNLNPYAAVDDSWISTTAIPRYLVSWDRQRVRIFLLCYVPPAFRVSRCQPIFPLTVNVATSAPKYLYLSKIIYKQKPHLLNACPAILISFTLLSSVGTDVCTLQKRRSPVRFCWWAPGRIYNP